MEHDVTKTGDENTKHYDVTVIFHTARLDATDAVRLIEEAKPLLEARKLGEYIKRNIKLFFRDPKTVAILHYEDTLVLLCQIK